MHGNEAIAEAEEEGLQRLAHLGIDQARSAAMAAGVSDTLRDMEWIVGLIDARAPKPKRPKTYQRREISN